MKIYSINHKYHSGKVPSRRASFLSLSNAANDRYHTQRGSSMGIFLTGLGILTVVCVVGSMYIFQITSSAVGGYDTSSLEKQINNLQDERRGLEMQVADLQSLHTIEQGANKLKLVSSDKVVYTSPISSKTIAYSAQNSGQ